MTEREFQSQVLELARLRGWRRAHFRPAQTQKGWRTAMSGDPGFPDTVLVRRGALIFAELKVGKNKPAHEQEAWLKDLGQVPGIVAVVWYPKDWPEIEEILE